MAQLEENPGEIVGARVEHELKDVNLASESGRARAEAVIEEVLAGYEAEALAGTAAAITPAEREQIGRELRDNLVGHGAIMERIARDKGAQEYMFNGARRVFRDDGERIERVHDICFKDDKQLRFFIERALEQVEGKRLDRITPLIEARLPDGSRLTAAIPPISSNMHPICNIRRFNPKANSLPKLREFEFCSEDAADFLAACVRAGKNIVVCGAVSSGKTTLLNALGREIGASERVVVCESSAELQLPRILPNCVGFEARPQSPDGLPAVTLDQLVASALRLLPSRILVGECRGPEALGLLYAFASGHAGMTSVHGQSCDHALRNLVRFALTAGPQITTEQALDWLREVDIAVHCTRPHVYRDGESVFLPRRIDEIVEVHGVEGTRLTLNPLFAGEGAELRWLGAGPRFLADLEAAGFRAPEVAA